MNKLARLSAAERRKIVDEHLATLAALLDEATFGHLEFCWCHRRSAS